MSGIVHLVYVLEHFEDVESESLRLWKCFQNKNTFGFYCQLLKV